MSISSDSASAKLTYFVLTLITGIALATVGAWASSVNGSVKDVESRLLAQEKLSIEINTKLNILLMQNQPNFKGRVQVLP